MAESSAGGFTFDFELACENGETYVTEIRQRRHVSCVSFSTCQRVMSSGICLFLWLLVDTCVCRELMD